MNHKELKELIDFLIERDISEFELERGDVKVKIKRGTAVQAAPVAQNAPAVVAAALVPPAPGSSASVPPPSPSSGDVSGEVLHIVKSPIVGTFYESPSPGAPAFVKAGDNVNAGQVVCIIEAMKLMNEIECDMAGEIVKRLVNNNQPVEYGQPLFAIRPSR
ncbi:MAG TPA: acetyl-CoA carboxylase biotin carboxyl carrier protein [Candidatus Saccharimonadales bacterium]|jgi:acetyl-CoA carboxylase biotin carboxyl carrier protein|nr:acetyl-CoA carboxylase biotin carboxyl carrier protein [Candidatus Saccharimonadales bacterium]